MLSKDNEEEEDIVPWSLPSLLRTDDTCLAVCIVYNVQVRYPQKKERQRPEELRMTLLGLYWQWNTNDYGLEKINSHSINQEPSCNTYA